MHEHTLQLCLHLPAQRALTKPCYAMVVVTQAKVPEVLKEEGIALLHQTNQLLAWAVPQLLLLAGDQPGCQGRRHGAPCPGPQPSCQAVPATSQGGCLCFVIPKHLLVRSFTVLGGMGAVCKKSC